MQPQIIMAVYYVLDMTCLNNLSPLIKSTGCSYCIISTGGVGLQTLQMDAVTT